MGKKPEQFKKVGENFDEVMDVLLKRKSKKMDRNTFIHELFDKFESVRQENESVEYWFARDLQELLGYTEWRNFQNAINKAKDSCSNSGFNKLDHFVDVNKMVSIGSDSKREIQDIALTRYACYLIAQNGDPRKTEIAFAQTYFAEQTRKFELIVKRMDELERIDARDNLRLSEKQLSGIVYKRGFTETDFGILRSKGDVALFGCATHVMKNRLKIPQGRPLADFLDTVVIKGKDFATAMTCFKIEELDLQGVENITKEHIINNSTVRKALIERGIYPERLPAKEDIKKIERRIKSNEKQLAKQKVENIEINQFEESKNEEEYQIHKINISKDLWKIALLIMATKPGGIITTTELIEEIPKYIIFPKKYTEISEIKKEPKYVQVIRNLKSNKRNKVNFINQGYVTDIRGGYQITKKGLDFVKEEFKDYI